MSRPFAQELKGSTQPLPTQPDAVNIPITEPHSQLSDGRHMCRCPKCFCPVSIPVHQNYCYACREVCAKTP